MKKILVLIILILISGTSCGEMTYEQRVAWSNFFQEFSHQQQRYEEQRLRQAQYNYYTRPYKVGDGPTIYP